MSKLTIFLGVLAIASLLTGTVHSEQIHAPAITEVSAEIRPEPPKPLTPVQVADKYASQYGVDPVIFKKVMWCESGNNPKAYNKNDPNGGSFGIMQFQIATFYSYAKKIKLENPDIHNLDHQIQVASYMFSIGQAKQWSCYRIVLGK